MKKRGRSVIKRHDWLLAITFFVWLLIILMIMLVDPGNVKDMVFGGSYILPGVLIYVGMFLLLSIMTLSGKRAFLWASASLIFIYLRLWGLGNYFNLLLLLGIVGSVEIYFFK